MKKLYFGSNLKMYKTPTETELYLQDLQERTKDISREEIELFILPSFVCLERAMHVTDADLIRIGAQTLHWEEEGQFTGEVSARMIEDLGLTMVMVGHSERRHVFGETDAEEAKRVQTALQHGFITLLCIGETAEEKEMDATEDVLREQLKVGLSSVTPETVGQVRVAYEPVWSIGVNGTPASAEYAGKVHATIKKILEELFGEAAAGIPVLYGGSVNPDNACDLIALPAVDGLYVGRAAWDAEKFDRLIREAMVKAKEAGKQEA